MQNGACVKRSRPLTRSIISCRKGREKCFSGFVRFVCFLKIQEVLDAAFELMGQQYSFVVKVLHDHALVLKDLAVLNQEGLASKRLVNYELSRSFVSLISFDYKFQTPSPFTRGSFDLFWLKIFLA